METFLLRNSHVTPALNLEPQGMFRGADIQSLGVPEIRDLFRRAAPGGLAQVPFIDGSEKLIAVPDLMPHLRDVVRVVTRDGMKSSNIDFFGGYAFLESGRYVFGVEEDSTLEDAVQWEVSIPTIDAHGAATIAHSYDRSIDAELNKSNGVLTLRHSRTGNIYQLEYPAYVQEVRRANELLRRFAIAIVPEIENQISVGDRKKQALESFKAHPEWFEN